VTDTDQERGYSFPEFDLMEKYYPEFEAVRKAKVSEAYTPKNAELPVAMREIIAAAVLAYKAYPTIEFHLRRAIREGATMRQLVEAMACASMPGGGPTLQFSLRYLREIEADIEAGRPV
jgi:alkylhydroperoxidase/carboxymuconolactone decarboxylase family protein YurZ